MMAAASYSFAAWNAADLRDFQNSYDNAMPKQEGRNPKLVCNFDTMKSLMIKNGAAEVRTLPPHVVGIHDDNRDKKLMSAGEMSQKFGKIVNVGASRYLCGPLRAWCVQDSEERAFYKWTLRTASTSNMFAVPSESIEYGSVGCSHLNQGLCALNQCRPTGIQALQDNDGFIDKARIFAEDETMKSLATTGLNWYVIKRGFVERFPQVPRIFSKALNAEHNIAMGETWDQQIRSVCTTAALLFQHDDIPWQHVQSQIRGSQGPHIDDLPSHVSFVRKYGGGMALSHIHELLDYFNMKLPAGRKVSGCWIHWLTSIPLTTDFAVPHLVHAIFKCHACCEELDCDGGIARYVQTAELKALASKRKVDALEAENVLARLKQVYQKAAGSKILEYGKVSVQIAEVVLGKNKNNSIKAAQIVMSYDRSCVFFPLEHVSMLAILVLRSLVVMLCLSLCSVCRRTLRRMLCRKCSAMSQRKSVSLRPRACPQLRRAWCSSTMRAQQ